MMPYLKGFQGDGLYIHQYYVPSINDSKDHICLDRRGHSQALDVEVQVYTRVLHLHKAVGRRQVQTG